MNPLTHTRLTGGSVAWLIAAALILLTSPAFSQNVGEVQIYVFSEMGLPLDDAYVEVDGQIYRADDSGLIDFTHPPGTHEFTIMQDEAPVGRVRISIRAAQATEVIITASEENLMQSRTDTADEEREEIEREERQELDTDAPSGTLTGTVTAAETGEPVENATVIFRGVEFETTTDEDGVFTARVPEGTYSFSIIHPDYSTQTRDEVEVTAEEETPVEVALTPAAIRLEEVPVFATEEVIVQGGIANLIEETRNSGVVLNLIGSEQINRTGDSTAAGALARVTGLNVVGGRFVYVRGMGERYSSSLLNDARLPSPEPDRRVVPLDLFPASVIESIAVQKSYSPELSGDFGGGAISIRSIGIPDDRYQRRLRTNIGASLGWNLGTTFTERLMSQGGPVDFLGIDVGTRALPEGLDEVDYAEEEISPITGLPAEGSLTQEEINELGRQLPNTWTAQNTLIPLNGSLSASVRDKIELGDEASLGFTIAGLYSNSWSYAEGQLNSYQATSDGFASYNSYDTRTTSQDIDVGALMDIKYALNSTFEIESTSLLVRTTDNVYEQLEGFLTDDNIDVRLEESSWAEQMLLSQGLAVRTELAQMNQSALEGQYTFSLAQRYEPDSRYVRFEEQVAGFETDGNYDPEYGHISARREDDNQRVWTTVQDFVHDGQLSMEIPIYLFGNPSPDFIDLGLYGMYQIRGTDLRRFSFFPTSNPTTDEYYWDESNSPGDILGPDSIGEEIRFQEGTYAADNYTGDALIGAGYVTTDILLPFDIRMTGGLRGEYSRQSVQAYTFPPPAQLETPVLDEFDLLPALNLTIPTGGTGQLRIGGSRTVNRPDLRELSSAPFFGPPGFGVIQGNPDLRRAVIWNADLRWETYLSMEESFSVGGFYKFFQDAIEIAQLQGAAFVKVPVNTASAFNAGAEMEWAAQLTWPSDMIRSLMLNLRFDSLETERAWRRALGGFAGVLRDIRTTGNVAWIYSQIDYGDQNLTYQGVTISNTSDTRPLQGQAPYVVNLGLGYRNEVSWSQDAPYHTSIFLNYNVVGPFITQLGVEGVPDQYRQPFHQLDLVFRQQLGFVTSISFEAGNLLNLPNTITLGNGPDAQIVESDRKGRTFSVSVSLDI